MISQNKETDSRNLIDDQLRFAGWNSLDKSQVLTDVKASAGNFVAEQAMYPTIICTSDGDLTPIDLADYVSLNQRGRPLTTIEVKKQTIKPYTTKQIEELFILITNVELIMIKGCKGRVEDKFRPWLVAKNLTSGQTQHLKSLKKRGLVKGKVSQYCLFAPPRSTLNVANIGNELFGEWGLRITTDDINQSVLVS